MNPINRAISHNTHPGEYLFEDIIKPNGLTIVEAAKLLGVSRPNLSNVVHGRSAVSPIMAIRISTVFGGNASLWMNLQSAYDLREAEKEFKEKNIHLNKYEFS